MNLRAIKVVIMISILTCLLFPINSLAIDILETKNLGSLVDGFQSQAIGVNNQGHVVGYAMTAEPYPYSFGYFQHAFFWTPDDEMIDIFEPHQDVSRIKINDLDQVVATYNQYVVDGSDYSLVGVFSVVWSKKDGKIIIPQRTCVYDINNLGQVVGYDYDNSEAFKSQYPYEDVQHLFVGFAEAINDSGQVAGTRNNKAIICTPENIITDLAPQYPISKAIDINQAGHIVGHYNITTDTPIRSFFWSKETGFIDIGTLGGNYTYARAINDLGEIVGESQNSDGSMEAFIWSPTHEIMGLGIGDGNSSVAQDVNNFSHVLGSISIPGENNPIFIWSKEDGMQFLNDAETYTVSITIGDGYVVGQKDWGNNEYNATLWKFQVNAPPEEQIDLIIT